MEYIRIIIFHKFKASSLILHVYDEFNAQCLECFTCLSLLQHAWECAGRAKVSRDNYYNHMRDWTSLAHIHAHACGTMIKRVVYATSGTHVARCVK